MLKIDKSYDIGKIVVIGTGYVGIVTGACFAEMGNEVCCVEKDVEKLRQIRRMELPIYEPGLEQLIKNNTKAMRLSFDHNIKKSLEGADICIIAVGTPGDINGAANLQYVFTAAEEIGEHMQNSLYIINKSTVLVGTSRKIGQIIEEKLKARKRDFDFEVISNPEFLKEGEAIEDCLKPERIIIGINNHKSEMKMRALYAPFPVSLDKVIVMDVESAEMTKYVANAFLATKISFMNEMANICEFVGADINKVRVGIGSDSRIGYKFIYPGCGYGGSCFPKDVKALINMGKEYDYNAEILHAVEAVNDRQKHKLIELIVRRFGKNLSNKKIAVWGLSFKPGTNDMREASSIVLIEELTKMGAKVAAYDPKAMSEAQNYYFRDNEKIVYGKSPYDILEDADALVLVTEWEEFRTSNYLKIKEALKLPIIFDGRNQFDACSLGQMGFEYFQIGIKVSTDCD